MPQTPVKEIVVLDVDSQLAGPLQLAVVTNAGLVFRYIHAPVNRILPIHAGSAPERCSMIMKASLKGRDELECSRLTPTVLTLSVRAKRNPVKSERKPKMIQGSATVS